MNQKHLGLSLLEIASYNLCLFMSFGSLLQTVTFAGDEVSLVYDDGSDATPLSGGSCDGFSGFRLL